MRLFLLALAACSTETVPAPAPIPVAVPVAKPIVPKPLPPVATGIHVGPIVMLAVSEDAVAALTSSSNGGLRFWPTLDGHREPVILGAPDPVDLAIAHTGSTFALAIVDQAKTLLLLHVDAEGHVLDHAQVATDVAALHATRSGFLALTSDQRVSLVGFDGTVSQLTPKQRVAALLYRSGRALALFASSPAHVKGQWIDLDKTATWGDETAELALDPKRIDLVHAVLSPDHTHLAVAGPGNRMLGFELATASVKSLATVCEPLAYLDDNTIACTEGTGVLLVSSTGKRLPTATFRRRRTRSPAMRSRSVASRRSALSMRRQSTTSATPSPRCRARAASATRSCSRSARIA
jgi:hypothetical protein